MGGRSEDAQLLVLKMGEESVNQGIQGASRSWKSPENRFFPRASIRKVTLLTL